MLACGGKLHFCHDGLLAAVIGSISAKFAGGYVFMGGLIVEAVNLFTTRKRGALGFQSRFNVLRKEAGQVSRTDIIDSSILVLISIR